MEPASQMNSASPMAESSSSDLPDEIARWMRRSLKTGGSIQALRVSEARRWRREYGNRAPMEMAFCLCTHCSFLTGSRLPNEGKDVARGGDPASVAAYVLQRSRMAGVAEEWTSSHSGHDVNWCALRERQVEELHQEEPTPVADVAPSDSYSEPRKLRLPLMFFQIPNHWRKCQERCRRAFFHIILFRNFTMYMYLRGGRGGSLKVQIWGISLCHRKQKADRQHLYMWPMQIRTTQSTTKTITWTSPTSRAQLAEDEFWKAETDRVCQQKWCPP